MDIQIITTTEELSAICKKIVNYSWVTIDSEFYREKNYFAQLCLLQIATEDDVWIIDTLAEDIDLSPFDSILQNQDIVKVFHSAFQDIEILTLLFNHKPKNVFDTQIAAMAAGFGDSVGYNSLVKSICHHSLDKSARYSDWRIRPLDNKQIEYAALDVIWLRDVYLYLVNWLAEHNRLDWVIDEITSWLDGEAFFPQPLDAWKRIKLRSHERSYLNNLQHLAMWRELKAIKKDLPRRHVVSDDVINDIAYVKPNSIAELEKIRSVPKHVKTGKWSLEIISALDEANKTPKDEWPKIKAKSVRLDEKETAAYDILRSLLKIVAKKSLISSSFIASSNDLMELIKDASNMEHKCLQGQRYEIFGKYAQDFLNGQLGIAFKDGDLHFIKDL